MRFCAKRTKEKMTMKTTLVVFGTAKHWYMF